MKSNQTTKPLITIVGITGKQGRSVARTLLTSGTYRVRGITRRSNSPEAIQLANEGVEVVSLSTSPGNKANFVNAFRGSHGVFLMTPNLAPPATHEAELGRELADAAVEAGVNHLVFSSLENVDKITGGKLVAPHFTDKAMIEEYIRTLPVNSSFIQMSFFYTNLLEFYAPILVNDLLEFPIYLPGDFRAPFVDPLTATGPAVYEIFAKPETYAGKTLPVIGEFISPLEMVETFMRVTGRQAVYRPAYNREDLLRHFPHFKENEGLVQELLGMVQYAVEYGYFRADRDLDWSRKINPNTLTWEQFLIESGWQGEKRSI